MNYYYKNINETMQTMKQNCFYSNMIYLHEKSKQKNFFK